MNVIIHEILDTIFVNIVVNMGHSLLSSVRKVKALHTSNSLMDLRSCGTDGDDTGPKTVTVQRQSSFSRKAASLKRLSRFVSEPNSYSVRILV